MAEYTKQIQAIFDETIAKIIGLVEINASTNVPPTTDAVSKPVIDKVKLSADIIPILQTFLMNVQIYHTATFNSIVNGISAVVPVQSLVQGDISQPSVSHKWQSSVAEDTSNSNISILENKLAGFAAMELNDTRPINLLKPDYTEYQPRSVASQETRRFWERSMPNSRQTYNSTPPNYVSSTQSNYDDFLKHYTDEFAKYHNTYVDDSSESENEELNVWTNGNSLIEQDSKRNCQDLETNQQHSGTQCCARLSKYMKYRIADFADDFIESYPPDTYIEGGFVFGKPCPNIISSATEDKGEFFCYEHINDTEVEDIRQPRPNINYDLDSGKDDNLEIVFSNEGYSGNSAASYDKPSTGDWEGFDYYREYDPKYSASLLINQGVGNDTFSKNHQCCARLNKFRLYRLELEPTNFLDTYPPDVYIEDGCIYGTACQNLISDEAYNSGIRFCIEHQSDPYVDNICEPMIIKNKSSKHDTQHTQNTLNIQNTQNYMKKSDLDLEETENIQNELPTKAISKSAMLKQPRQYEWDKYNTDFNYLC